jgi:hypothetical protein
MQSCIPWIDPRGRIVIGYERKEFATPIIPFGAFGIEGTKPIELCEMHRWFEIHPVYREEYNHVSRRN